MRKTQKVAMFAMLSLSSVALADRNGRTGSSGKQNANCSDCHDGSTDAIVTIVGPTSLAPNASASYMLSITGGAASKGGFDVAVSAGSLSNPSSGARLANGEICHSTPKSFANGAVSWMFTVTAPKTGTSFTIYGAGVSSNGNGAGRFR